jgi:3-hydroxyisobutyrate dehydrogenase-like beta-hydroxyacid dehydrogenase
MMTATTLEMLGEVVAVARKRGLDPKPFRDIIDKHDVRRAGAQNLRR